MSETRKLPAVSVEVFAQRAGVKRDQLEPFLRYARKRKLAERTVPDWSKAWREFLAREV